MNPVQSARRTDAKACSRCASIKQACDGSMPCGRCARLSLPCHGSNRSTPPSKATPKVTRVHTGCASCKRRKRKCDEQKPKCSSCVKLCLDCQWPEGWRRRSQGSVTESSLGSTTNTASDASASPSPLMLFDGLSTTRPVLEDAANVPVSPFSVPGWDARSGGPRTYGTCGDSIPEQHANVHSPLADTITPVYTEDICQLTSTAPILESAAMAISLTRTPGLAPQLGTGDERKLFSHFINTTAICLTRAHSTATNLYLRYLLPLAFSEQAVMDAILALSASQQEGRGSVDGQVTIYYQSRAARQLHKLLSSSASTSPLMALTTSLILCMTELYGGSTDVWKQHLRGSKQLLDVVKKTVENAALSEEVGFVEDLYRFLDTSATISTCRPPLVADQEHQTGSRLPIYGVPKLLFYLLDRVNSLAYQRRTRLDEESEMAFRQTAQSVVEAVDFHIDICEVSDGQHQADITHASSAFKWAMRLRLTQIIDGYDAANPQIVGAVDNILHNIKQVPTTSISEATLLFPLIMAAGACVDIEDRYFIRERLIGMKERSGFGHIYSAHELAERVWMYRDLEYGSTDFSTVNWASIRHHEMHGLAIF